MHIIFFSLEGAFVEIFTQNLYNEHFHPPFPPKKDLVWCSGEAPLQMCKNLGLHGVFLPSDKFRAILTGLSS